MANLQGFTASATGLTVVLDDGTSQDFNFPVVTPPAPAPAAPTEEAVKAAVDAAVTSAFTAAS